MLAIALISSAFLRWYHSKRPAQTSPQQQQPAPSHPIAPELVELRALIARSLDDLRDEVESEPMDTLMQRADVEDEWGTILLETVRHAPAEHATSGALIGYLCDLPHHPRPQVLTNVREQLLLDALPANPAGIRRNAVIALGMLADVLAGYLSELLMTDAVVDVLFEAVRQSSNLDLRLHAVITGQKFAATAANKARLVVRGMGPLLWQLEQDHQRDVASEAHFAVVWSLDNVFPCVGREFSQQHTDLTQVNVMVDAANATPHLKLGPDGLEIRNDSTTFESVRATCSATAGALWYYEVTLLSAGVMQIGWVTDHCTYQSEAGVGVGDDAFSVAIDGCRRFLWHRQHAVPHDLPRWRAGDVVGLLLDLAVDTSPRMAFALNGHVLPWAALPTGPHFDGGCHFYPAVSLMTFQHVRLNFGTHPYSHAPQQPFRSLNAVGRMTAAEKRIVPRLAALPSFGTEAQAADPSAPLCQICFDSRPAVRLLPCGHAEFCAACAAQCAHQCPLCRGAVTIMEQLSDEDDFVGDEDDGDDGEVDGGGDVAEFEEMAA